MASAIISADPCLSYWTIFRVLRKLSSRFWFDDAHGQAAHAYWEHMVKKFPELERGLSASETGRDYIPPRVFKKMIR